MRRRRRNAKGTPQHRAAYRAELRRTQAYPCQIALVAGVDFEEFGCSGADVLVGAFMVAADWESVIDTLLLEEGGATGVSGPER